MGRRGRRMVSLGLGSLGLASLELGRWGRPIRRRLGLLPALLLLGIRKRLDVDTERLGRALPSCHKEDSIDDPYQAGSMCGDFPCGLRDATTYRGEVLSDCLEHQVPLLGTGNEGSESSGT